MCWPLGLLDAASYHHACPAHIVDSFDHTAQAIKNQGVRPCRYRSLMATALRDFVRSDAYTHSAQAMAAPAELLAALLKEAAPQALAPQAFPGGHMHAQAACMCMHRLRLLLPSLQ